MHVAKRVNMRTIRLALGSPYKHWSTRIAKQVLQLLPVLALSAACSGRIAPTTGPSLQRADYSGACPVNPNMPPTVDPFAENTSPTQRATCDELSAADLRYAARCSLNYDKDADAAVARQQLCAGYRVAAGSGITDIAIGQCVDALLHATCDAHLEATWCHQIVYGTYTPKGTLPLGYNCANDLQCASGECTSISCLATNIGNAGICATYVKDEQPCDATHLCEYGVTQCRDGRCRRGPYPGEKCAIVGKSEAGPCQTGSVCIGSSESLGAHDGVCKKDPSLNYCVNNQDCPGCGLCRRDGVCETYAELGEACGVCKPGASCIEGKCAIAILPPTRVRPTDGTCINQDDCARDLFCIAGKCVAPTTNLQLGQLCSSLDTCEAGLACPTGDAPSTCQPLRKLGESCKDQRCASPGLCTMGPARRDNICIIAPKLGEPCDYSPGCSDGTVCSGWNSGHLGVCRRVGAEGAACGPNQGPCFGGFACIEGRCGIPTGACQ
jgi:hypothetical protein